jgi:hypothetical protein
MSRVWLRMAGTSEAAKYSPLPRPITTGGPSRAATILFGSWRLSTARANTPRSCLTAQRTALSRLPSKYFSTRWAMTSVSVSVRKNVAFFVKLLFQLKVIFNDAVVDDDNIARAVAMRMRILFSRPPMSSPPGMADSVVAVDRVDAQHIFEVTQLA